MDLSPEFRPQLTTENSNGNDGDPSSVDITNDSEESYPRSPLAPLMKGSLSSDRKLRVNGQPSKKRGPKPDSKPALTRRQELNRQAQRTHRERKELYIKALEQEVLRLKETFGTVCNERDAFKDDNQKLRSLLAGNGIACHDGPSITGPSPTESISAQGNTESNYQQLTPQSALQGEPLSPPSGDGQAYAPPSMDYDQIGISFVLALEKPCMDHMQMLCNRSQSSDGEISGHVMMATCPPVEHTIEHPDVLYPHKMPELHQMDLIKLLDLSSRLPLDGEITPVMAWSSIIHDTRFNLLTEVDIADVKAELESKIRCYGFGAVLEEFEVKDALASVLAARSEGADKVMTSFLDLT